MRCKNIYLVLIVLSLSLFVFSCGNKGTEAIEITPSSQTIRVGKTVPLSVASDLPVVWTSSSDKIATVNAAGLVTGINQGTASITATAGEAKGVAAITVLPGEVSIGYRDTGIGKESFQGYEYQLFGGIDAFKAKVQGYFAAGTSIDLDKLTIVSFDFPENTFLQGDELKFLPNEKFPLSLVENVQPMNAIRDEVDYEFSKIMNFVLKYEEEEIPFNWVPTEGQDSFILPGEGEILLSNSDVEVRGITTESFTFVLKGLKTKIANSFMPGTTTGDGVISFAIKEGTNPNPLKTVTDTTLSDSITMEITGLEEATTYKLTLALNVADIKLNADPTPVITEIFNHISLNVATATPINVDITPVHLSIARKTSIEGVPEDKATALFNFGAEMEVLLRGVLGSDYDLYNFKTATWSADFVDSEEPTKTVGVVKDAPYVKRTEFKLDTIKNYQLSLKNAVIKVGRTSDPNSTININLNLTSDKIWGDTFRVLKDAEFPQRLYFKKDANGNMIETDDPNGALQYDLVIADDFNYHFNGLNYKSYENFNNVKRDKNADEEAFSWFRMWKQESPNEPQKRKEYSWDIRTTETKNSFMLQKIYAADPVLGSIYLGTDFSKALTGFTDLRKDDNRGSILSGHSLSESIRFGYVESKLRVKKKAYNDADVFGPWYAFWTCGAMAEFDMMEFVGGKGSLNNQVTHWTDGQGTLFKPAGLGGPHVTYGAPDNYEYEFWTLGVYWDETQIIYSLDGKPTFRLYAADPENKSVNSWLSDETIHGRKVTGVRTTERKLDIASLGEIKFDENSNVDPVIGGSGSHVPYGVNYAKGISDYPQRIYMSSCLTSTSSGWGVFKYADRAKLPTWLEVEYVAYYLPNSELTGLDITTEVKNDLGLDETIDLNFNYIPSHTPTKEVTWSSSDELIAEVDQNGLVTAVGAGKVTITVTSDVDDSIKDFVEINVVTDKVPVSSISLNETTKEMQKGEEFTLVATILPADASVRTVKWKSSSENVATVDENGKVTAKNYGTATITVTSDDTAGDSSECVVTVTRAESDITTAPENFVIDGVTYKVIEAFNFDESDADNSATLVLAGCSEAAGQVLNNGGEDKINVNVKELPKTPHYVLVRMKYDYDVQVWLATGGKIYSFARATGAVSTNWSNTVATNWAYDGTKWQNFGLLSTGDGNITYDFNDANPITTAGATSFNAQEMSFQMQHNDTAIGQNLITPMGIHEVEYIAFYEQFIPVQSIVVNGSTDALAVDAKKQLSVAYTPENTTQKNIAWASDDETIATVDENGLVEAVSDGTTNITATSKDNSEVSASFEIVVEADKIAVASISLSEVEDSYAAGATVNLVATITPNDATNQEVTWESSDTAIATVTDSGAVTSLAGGTVDITVRSVDDTTKFATKTLFFQRANKVNAPGTYTINGIELTLTEAFDLNETNAKLTSTHTYVDGQIIAPIGAQGDKTVLAFRGLEAYDGFVVRYKLANACAPDFYFTSNDTTANYFRPSVGKLITRKFSGGSRVDSAAVSWAVTPGVYTEHCVYRDGNTFHGSKDGVGVSVTNNNNLPEYNADVNVQFGFEGASRSAIEIEYVAFYKKP